VVTQAPQEPYVVQAYIIRRLLLIIPTLFLVSVFIFIILRLLPGDVALIILTGGGTTQIDPQQYAELKEQLGLNDPWHVQYVEWIWGMLRLEGGESLWTGNPVFEDISRALPATIQLTIMALLISLVIAVPLGILSAMHRNSLLDYGMRTIAISGLAMPDFLVGAMLVLVLILTVNWIPPLDYAGFFENPASNLQQMIWPALILGYIQAAFLARMIRSTTLEVLGQDYIRTAWSKGLASRHVYIRHALRNALLPVITVAGIQTAQLLGGAVIVENIFAIPGLGFKLLEAIVNRDWVTLQTVVTIFALAILLINLIIDLFYGWLDPRIRYG